VNDTAETILTQKTSATGCRHCCSRPTGLRWRERQRSMWPVPVVVIAEHLKGPLKVLLVQNEQPVETFRAGRAHESSGSPVGLWRETACERPQSRRSGTPRQNDENSRAKLQNVRGDSSAVLAGRVK
jgi:hypothetical protein